MKKIILLSCILLLSAVCTVAQNQSESGTSATGTNKMTVEGCLSESNGNYMLATKSGTTYQLTGDTASLQAHVGHTIQVTGTSTSGESPMAGNHSMSKSADMQPTLSVASFKHVSGSCPTQ
jgi:hypothetical protein